MRKATRTSVVRFMSITILHYYNKRFMNTEEQWNKAILDMTLKINAEFPELSKYISEMPVTIPDSADPQINIKNLKEYHNSLETLLKKYTNNHDAENKNIL